MGDKGVQGNELQINLSALGAAFGVGAVAIWRANSRLFTHWSISRWLFTFLRCWDREKMSMGPPGASTSRRGVCVLTESVSPDTTNMHSGSGEPWPGRAQHRPARRNMEAREARTPPTTPCPNKETVVQRGDALIQVAQPTIARPVHRDRVPGWGGGGAWWGVISGCGAGAV